MATAEEEKRMSQTNGGPHNQNFTVVFFTGTVLQLAGNVSIRFQLVVIRFQRHLATKGTRLHCTKHIPLCEICNAPN